MFCALTAPGGKPQFPASKLVARPARQMTHKDRWFCGITPDYVGVVWFGYDTPKDIPGYTTASNPALIAWQRVMSEVDKTPIKSDFPTNGNVVSEAFSNTTGYITSQGTEYGWYKSTGVLPSAPVDVAGS